MGLVGISGIAEGAEELVQLGHDSKLIQFIEAQQILMWSGDTA